MDHSAVINLYKDEIDTYKQQINDLKARNKDADDKNSALLDKIRRLEDLIEKANVANQDLHQAFEHMRKENMQLQLRVSNKPDNPGPEPDQDADSKALETVQQQYANLARDSVSWISNKDQMSQRIKFLERECERYHRDNTTLGKQVRHLLKTLEEERGMIIRHQNEVSQDERMTCAADVIDKHLVTFESIEELQQQNQKILSLLKDMSTREEERETQVESEEVKRLTSDIETLRQQLESVKTDRERILNAFNTIHKERDLFKILLSKTRQAEHMTPEIFQRMVSIACSSGAAIAAGTSDVESSPEKDAHINDLKSIISRLEQEIKALQTELANLRVKSEEELRLRGELLEKAHAKIIEETKRADVLNERNELLESNIKKLTNEFDDMRTKCQKMTFETDQLKRQNEELKDNNEQLERQRQELARTVEIERQQSQKAAFEIGQLVEQKQELVETLEQERQARKSELSQIFSEIQERQIRELEERTAKQVELRVQLSNSERQVQELNNLLHQKVQELNANADARLREAELSAQTRETELKQKLSVAEIEVQKLKSQIDDAIQNNDRVAANRIKELEALINSKDQCAQVRIKELEGALVAKDQAAGTKLRELEAMTGERKELEEKLAKAQQDIINIQHLRNLERESRLRLSREMQTITKKKTNLTIKHRPKKANRRVRFSSPIEERSTIIYEHKVESDEQNHSEDLEDLSQLQDMDQMDHLEQLQELDRLGQLDQFDEFGYQQQIDHHEQVDGQQEQIVNLESMEQQVEMDHNEEQQNQTSHLDYQESLVQQDQRLAQEQNQFSHQDQQDQFEVVEEQIQPDQDQPTQQGQQLEQNQNQNLEPSNQYLEEQIQEQHQNQPQHLDQPDQQEQLAQQDQHQPEQPEQLEQSEKTATLQFAELTPTPAVKTEPQTASIGIKLKRRNIV